jgi:hypothetical protein
VVLAVAACGSDESAKGINAACTRSSDCDNGLSCLNGLCEPPDAGVQPDAGSDTNLPPDAALDAAPHG